VSQYKLNRVLDERSANTLLSAQGSAEEVKIMAWNAFTQELKSWFSAFGTLLPVFILFVTITSWLSHITDWQLLPIFVNSIEAFRAFTSLLFDVLFYIWLVPGIEYVIYVLLVALEPITKIAPYLPNIDLPPWARDAALVSAILLRAQTNAMSYADPLTTLEMNHEEEDEWKTAQEEMPLAIRMAVRFLWYVVLTLYFATKFITYPFKWINKFRIKETIRLLVGGGLMLGIAYFVHDGVLVSASTGLGTRHSRAHRAFMKALVISLVAAFFASLAFFAVNGYFVHS